MSGIPALAAIGFRIRFRVVANAVRRASFGRGIVGELAGKDVERQNRFPNQLFQHCRLSSTLIVILSIEMPITTDLFWEGIEYVFGRARN